MARFAVNTNAYLSEVRERRIPAATGVRPLLLRITGSLSLARVLVLDKWTSNSDGRQAVFCRKNVRSRWYDASFIDQGYCFSASEWTFLDYPLRGVYSSNCVYEGVRGWEAFEPALTRAESIDAENIWQCAADIPEEWYEGDRPSLERVVEELCKRRVSIRGLITDFRRSNRNPFPGWKDSLSIPVCFDNRTEQVNRNSLA